MVNGQCLIKKIRDAISLENSVCLLLLSFESLRKSGGSYTTGRGVCCLNKLSFSSSKIAGKTYSNTRDPICSVAVRKRHKNVACWNIYVPVAQRLNFCLRRMSAHARLDLWRHPAEVFTLSPSRAEWRDASSERKFSVRMIRRQISFLLSSSRFLWKKKQ